MKSIASSATEEKARERDNALGDADRPEPSVAARRVPHGLLELRIQQAFAATPTLTNVRITVETFTGIAQLSGVVNSRSEVNAAVRVAGQVIGVHSIRNCMRLPPSPNGGIR